MAFWGRELEIEKLSRLKDKKTASLVCVLGRRRIGKSFLIQKFGERFKRYVEIQGLGPHEKKHSLKDQLIHFSKEISEQFDIKEPSFSDWDDAFMKLADLTKSGETLIFLDEISWMAKDDKLFSAKLKAAWDSRFKKNQKLIMVLCGSVSTWIEDNILKNTNFEGRLSLEINLLELELKDANKFFPKNVGDFERMMALSITGGVPKYLEEIPAGMPMSKAMSLLCFSPNGILFNDFDKIFLDIFQRKSKTYERIIRALLVKKYSPIELARKAKVEYNSEFFDALRALELSGFISRDYYFNPMNNTVSKFSHVRVKDNYLRFYLKVIEPIKDKILYAGVEINDLSNIKGIDALLGYQFENVLLANRKLIHAQLQLLPEGITASSPYVQKKSTLNKGSCQIDLLIQTQLDVFFLCEFKCQKKIGRSVINEVKKKMEVLKLPKRCSLKPVLIYLGEINSDDQEHFDSFFYKQIYFGEL